jgi:ketosteroid isomerase-like protein
VAAWDTPSEAATMHRNAQRIETLYAALAKGDADAAAACYADDAYFEDIAFRRHGRKKIHEMWRMVCHAKPEVKFGSVIADGQRGSGHWTAEYMFGKTDAKPGRPAKPGHHVFNDVTSVFTFRDDDDLIVEHHDHCDAKAWARQAYPSSPMSFFAGSVGPLRRLAAAIKLYLFLKSHR